MERQLQHFPDQERLSRAAAREVAAAIGRAVERQGWCSLVLSGGSSPQRLYELLAGPPLSAQIAWDRVHVFWSDERCVGPEDRRSNYFLARTSLLEHVHIPSAHIHRMRGEIDPRQAALESEQDIRSFFAQRSPGQGMPAFDLVLLGMGVDGHSASLFPGDDAALREREKFVIAVRAPEGMPVAQRLSMSTALLCAARDIFFIVCGSNKQAVLDAVLAGGPAAQHYPAARISARGRSLWFVAP